MRADRGGLRGAQVVIEDEHVRIELGRTQDDLVELSFADHAARIEPITGLDDPVDDNEPGRARELR